MIPAIGAARALVESAGWTGPLLFLAKLTMIAAIGRVTLSLMTRATAAARHLVAVATLAAVCALPWTSALLPQWRLAILPRAASAAASAAQAVPVSLTRSVPPGEAATVNATRPASGAYGHWRESLPGSGVEAPVQASAPRGAPGARQPASPAEAAPARPGLALEAGAVALLALAAVAAVLLVQIAFSLLLAWGVSRRAREVVDGRMWRELDRACESLGIRGPVDLRSTRHVTVPAISGFVRPTLLLPESAAAWDGERLRVVFLHELAHVRRRDALTQLLARVATAFFWFHPLVWGVAREARRECERACDDMVLRAGVRASRYAELLLAVARAAGRDSFAGLTLAFARRSSLEGRLLSILRADARRGAASGRAMAVAAVLATALLLPLAAVRVVAASTAPEAPDAPAAPAAPRVHAGTRTRFSYFETRSTSSSVQSSVSLAETGDAPEPAAAPEPARAPSAVRLASHTPRTDLGSVNSKHLRSHSGEEWYSDARDAYNDHDYEVAGDAYRNAAASGFRVATALYNAACSYSLGGQRGLALSALSDAIDAGWDDPGMIASDDDFNPIRSDRRFQLLLRRAQHTDAGEQKRSESVTQFDALKASGSTDADDWGSVGISLMRAGENQLAEDAFDKEIRLNGSSNAMYNKACAFALDGDADRAFQALEQAILSGYGDVSNLRRDSDLTSLHGDPRFDHMVRLTRDLALNTPIFFGDNPSSWRGEVSRYEDLTRQYPQLGRAWSNLGYVQLKARLAGDALASFGRSLDLGYRKPATMYNLACSAAQAGKADAAFDWLARSRSAGMDLASYLWSDRDLDPLRSDRRFKDLVRNYRDDDEYSDAK